MTQRPSVMPWLLAVGSEATKTLDVCIYDFRLTIPEPL